MKRKILKIYAKLKIKFNVDYVLTQQERDIFNIFIKFLYADETKTLFFPQSEKWMLITPDERYFLILQHKYIKIANHQFFTEKEIHENFYRKMRMILNKKVENDRLKYEKMIERNFEKLMEDLSKNIK